MSVVDGALTALVGFGLGAVTGMPIGVVNVAIVDAAVRGEKRFATGIGIGGALADTVHAGIAFVGIGQLAERHPEWLHALAIAAAVIIVGYAVFGARRLTAAKPRAGSGVLTGLVLTLPNPAPLVAWGAIGASLWPAIPTGRALIAAAGVGLGSAVWFVLLARWISGLPREGRLAKALPRVALALLVVVAIAGLVRALR